MRKALKILLVVFAIIAIPAIIIIVNRIKAKYLAKEYLPLGQIIESKSFVLKELDLKGKTLEYFHAEDNVDHANELDPALQHLEPARHWPKSGGYVQFDTLKKHFVICTNEYVTNLKDSDRLPDEQKNVFYFNSDGQSVGSSSNLYSYKKEWLQNGVVLLDYIPNFPNWKNKKAEIYLKHFGIEQLETDWLNPFRGMGSPTGVGPAPAWSGTGYFDLHIGGETIHFRSPATKDGLMLLESNDFETDLSYCKMRRSFNKALPVFLVYQPRHGQGRVFIITRKNADLN